MARKPEVFVRELDPEEAQRLVRVSRTARDRVRLRRAGMVLASLQGRSAPEIAVMFAAKEQTVRDVISAFNDRGFAALDPKGHRGSMPKIGPVVREEICRTAKSDPRPVGVSVHLLEPDQAAGLSGRTQAHSLVSGGDPAGAQGREDLLAVHQDLEALERPRVHAEEGPDPGVIRPSTTRWSSPVRG